MKQQTINQQDTQTGSGSRRSGFTLIEILIVISIIVLLAAMIFPAFNRAKEKAGSATCQSNLKQLATAWTIYAQDYDERTTPMYARPLRPPAPAPVPDMEPGPYLSNTAIHYWPDLLYPYVKSGTGKADTGASARGVFGCPTTNNLISHTNTGGWISVRYAYNQSNMNDDYVVFDNGDYSSGVKMAKFGHPAETIIFSEGTMGSGPFLLGSHRPTDNVAALQTAYPASGSYPAGFSPERPMARAANPHDDSALEDSIDRGRIGEDGTSYTVHATDRTLHQHSSGANYAFADGHVKWLKQTPMKMWTASS